jgi:hypothetical protein
MPVAYHKPKEHIALIVFVRQYIKYGNSSTGIGIFIVNKVYKIGCKGNKVGYDIDPEKELLVTFFCIDGKWKD